MPRTNKVWKKTNRSKNFSKVKCDAEAEGSSRNIHTSPAGNNTSPDTQPISSSAKKLSNLEDNYSEIDTREFGNEIVDLNILNDVLRNKVCCKQCHQGGLILNVKRRYGLASEISFSCEVCDYNCSFFSSMILSNDNVENNDNDDNNNNGGDKYNDEEKSVNKKGSFFECNLRLVYGMRAIGCGQSSAQVFCGMMNLPNPPQKFMKYTDAISPVVQNVTEESMRMAVEEAIEHNDTSRDLKTAFDGSWQKRGHTSKNGFVSMTSVDTGKVLDVEVLSKHCRCKDKNNHQLGCCANYSGSSGGMETAGVTAIYQRSSEKYNVRYLYYLGDGDSKAYKTVSEMNIYGSNTAITKLECIGHVQKRMGSRLRRFKVSMKNKKLEDGRTISGKNRLTDALIDKIQLYYGLAIRRNIESVENMRKGVWAMYFHLCSQDNDPQHGLCPVGPDSWCGYQKSQAIEGYEYTHKHNVPKTVMNAIKPIIRDLSSSQLLQKCTHGRTQNPNESVNSVVWSRIPKSVFVTYKTLVFGVYDAVGCFNDGNIVRCRVLKQLGMDVGVHTKNAMMKGDNERVRKAEMAVSEFEKLARQRKRQASKRLEDTEVDADNPEYGPGLF